MEKFGYLPRLIVAYDGDVNDKSVNLIHVNKAEQGKDYYCPCCGNVVRSSGIDSNKVQPHYYHINGDCDVESQVHWFYKNWLFDSGSKFKVDDNEVVVESVDIEKTHTTPYGNYRPDITVYSKDGAVYYFEMFFTNGKRRNDYFCKWKYLNNPVIQVEIKEYMTKDNVDDIPEFKYLYNDGECFCKKYKERDVYINTIQKRINQLSRQEIMNYKSRIEKLDYFWQLVIERNSDDDLINAILDMEFDDAAFCYEMVKKQQCVKYLAETVLEALNKKTLDAVKSRVDLPYDENVYLGLYKYSARTFEIGIIIDIDEPDIHIKEIRHLSHWNRYYNDKTNLNNLNGFPKIVFKDKLFTECEIIIPDDKIENIKQIFDDTVKYRDKLLKLCKKVNKSGDIKICVDGEKISVYLNDDGFKYIGNIELKLTDEGIQKNIDKLKNKYYKDIKLNEYYNSVKDQITEFESKHDCQISFVNNKVVMSCNGRSFERCLRVGNIDKILNKFHQIFLDINLRFKLMSKYSNIINFRAKMWSAYITKYNGFLIKLIDTDNNEEICYRIIYNDWETEDEFIRRINETLEKLLWDAEYYHGVRFMEGK